MAASVDALALSVRPAHPEGIEPSTFDVITVAALPLSQGYRKIVEGEGIEPSLRQSRLAPVRRVQLYTTPPETARGAGVEPASPDCSGALVELPAQNFNKGSCAKWRRRTDRWPGATPMAVRLLFQGASGSRIAVNCTPAANSRTATRASAGSSGTARTTA